MDNDLKRASWLELFYDVAFVALVAQLTYLASAHYSSVEDWFTIGIVGYAIFIAWWATTANRNFQPTETVLDKLLIQLQMVGMFFLSLAMPAMFEESYAGFFITLGLLRMLQAFMMGRMYYLHPELRPKTYNILEGFLIGAVLWIVSAFMPPLYVFVTALMALTVDVLTPLTRGKGNNTRYLNVYHLQERLGLFLMLVVGESMIVVALSSSASRLTAHNITVVFAGLLLMIAFWWLYFEHSDRFSGNRPWNLFYYLHAHGGLFLSLILLSVGYRLVLKEAGSVEALLLILVGAIGLSVTLIIIRAMLHPLCRRGIWFVVTLFLVGIVVVKTALVYQVPVLTLLIISFLFSIVAVLDALGWFRNTDNVRLTLAKKES